jgi:hypothetical protein
MGRMGPFLIVVRQPLPNTISRFKPFFKGIQINAFVFQRPLKPLNHPIVPPCTFTVHADFDLRFD